MEKSVNGRPFIQNYVPYAYHGSNQVWEIIQDDRGIMYFANSETGILEYDGVSWCTIALDNRDTCRSLAKDRDGRIYAGGVGEIGYLEIINGETVYVSLKTHLPEAHRDFKDVWKTAVAESGVYFQTGHKIFRWHDGKFSIITTETGFRRATCAVNGKVYTYQKKTGVMEIVGNEMRLIPGGDVFADDQVYLMLPRENDTIMFVSEKQGLFVYDGNTVSHFPTEADAFIRENELYKAGVVLSDGMIAIGTQNGGIVVLDRKGKIVKIINYADGLQNNNVRWLFLDRWNGLWAGLNKGISRIEFPSPFTLYDERDGYDGVIDTIVRHGNDLFVTTSIGLYRSKNAFPKTGVHFEGVFRNGSMAWDMTSVHDDALLVCISNLGVLEIRGDTQTLVGEFDGMSAYELCLSGKFPYVVFVGLREGLGVLRYEEGQWRNLGKVEKISGKVRGLEEDSAGKIYVKTQLKGLYVCDFSEDFDHPEITRFHTGNGLPKGHLSLANISGEIFLVSNRAIYKFEPNTQDFYRDDRFDKRVFPKSGRMHVQTDHRGNIWIRAGINSEIFRAVKTKNDAFEIRRTPFQRLRKFRPIDIYAEENGLIWFGGAEGLICYDTNSESRDYNESYNALIRSVNAKGGIIFGKKDTPLARISPNSYEGKGYVVLPYEKNSIGFDYASPYFDDEAMTLYQVWLEGHEDTWSDWTKNNLVYTNLMEGSYRFHIRSKNLYGAVSREALYPFRILPPWYRTWWAYVIYVAALILMTAGISLALMLRVKRKAERKLKEKQRFLDASNRFVPKQFLDHLRRPSILDVRLGDCIQNDMSILFTDIRSFTTISETMSPEENFDFINRFLNRMAPIIRKHSGFVDKFIGDAIMALFGENHEDAISTGIAMLGALHEYNCGIDSGNGIPIRIGIGINSGSLMLGTIGETHRMETTVISDTVNLASRLEGMTKMYGVQLLISGDTFERLKDPGRFSMRFIDRVQAKGKSDPVDIFEVYDGDSPDIRKLKDKIKTPYFQAIEAYKRAGFQESKKFFEKCLEVHPEDKVSRIYLERCDAYLKNGWDENWEMVTKLDAK